MLINFSACVLVQDVVKVGLYGHLVMLLVLGICMR